MTLMLNIGKESKTCTNTVFSRSFTIIFLNFLLLFCFYPNVNTIKIQEKTSMITQEISLNHFSNHLRLKHLNNISLVDKYLTSLAQINIAPSSDSVEEIKSNLKKLSEMYNNTNFEEKSPEGQLTRFALFGAFIFFSEPKSECNQKICGISTLNFPKKYPEEPFDGLVLNTPISYIYDDSTIESYDDVTIPYLKINNAKKYKVDLSKVDKNSSCFEFIYELIRKEFKYFVKCKWSI